MKFPFLRSSEVPSLQLYGKLPVARDYLRIGCGDAAAQAFRDWLDGTFGTAREGDETLELARPVRFFGWSERAPIQGCLWPSSDAGQHRRFPFALLVERHRATLEKELGEGNLEKSEPLWQRLADLRERCLDAESGEALLRTFRGSDVNLGDMQPSEGSAADYGAWIDALWPGEGEDGLRETVEALRSLASARYAGPLRLPLVTGLPLRDQAVAWVRVLRLLGVLDATTLPTLFLPLASLYASGEPEALLVSPRALTGPEVVWLTAPVDGPSLGTADLAAEVGAAVLDASSAPDADRWLRDALPATVQAWGSGG